MSSIRAVRRSSIKTTPTCTDLTGVIVASPLLINIVELTRRPGIAKEVQVDVSAESLAFDDERIDTTHDIGVDLRVESVSGGLVVHGEATARASGVCSRCLIDIDLIVHAAIDEIYQRVPDNPEAYPLDGEALDLAPIVREMVLLGVPEAPLCRADCPGLCPTCGANLAAGPCGCVPKQGDERWAVLDQLKGRLPE
jgi:uncharacterized protein